MSKKILAVSVAYLTAAAFLYMYIPDPRMARAAIIALLGLTLWLTELIPFPATTLLLCSVIPLFLSSVDPQYSFRNVLLWVANPVLALFFGGFVMSVAMNRHDLDRFIAHWILRLSRGRASYLMIAAMFGTAILSMWLSNIAAAAIVITALKPVWGNEDSQTSIRTPLLLSVAFGANFGGMATPIGSGPNAIAIAAVQSIQKITFVEWMMFGIPLTFGMLILALILIRFCNPIQAAEISIKTDVSHLSFRARIVAGLFGVAALLWLLEPLHGIPAPVVAVLLSAVLFATQLLSTKDLASVDWQTLFLIAGGLVLGELVNRSGITQEFAKLIQLNSVPRTVMIFFFIFTTAFFSAIASNTAAAALMIPFAMSLVSSPTIAILIAMGTSMGAPFVISTPPNSMAYAQGGLSTRHFLIPGFVLMIVGCLILTFTGEKALNLFGVR